jgi:hypothetical protein
VWQGSAGDRRPYADLVAKCRLMLDGGLFTEARVSVGPLPGSSKAASVDQCALPGASRKREGWRKTCSRHLATGIGLLAAETDAQIYPRFGTENTQRH